MSKVSQKKYNLTIPPEVMPYDALFQVYKGALSNAYSVIHTKGKQKILIHGTCSSGKTTLLDTLIYHCTHEEDEEDNLVFVKVDEDVVNSLKVNNIRANVYVEKLAKTLYKCDPSKIVVVTNNPKIAIMLERNEGLTAPLILEASDDYVNGVNYIWEGWSDLDLETTFLPEADMRAALTLMKPLLQQNKRIKVLANAPKVFLRYLKDVYPNEVFETSNGVDYVMVAPGIICSAYNDVVNFYNFGLSKNTSFYDAMRQADTANATELFKALKFSSGEETISIGNLGKIGISVSEISQIQDEKKPKMENKPVVKPVFADNDKFTSELKARIIGQDSALDKISTFMHTRAILPSVYDDTRPIASFLFAGPTGVGKTETALLMAKNTFKKPMNVIRLDMSEYSSEHEVSKLFGAPPGYAGFEQGGTLTSAIAKDPHSLVLIDEIEKAHPKIFDSFLQILDYGFMTSGKGERVSFENAILVFTSNLGNQKGYNMSGFQSVDNKEELKQDITKRELGQFFRPEFLNRLDEIIVFNTIDKEYVDQIINDKISVISKKIGYELDYDNTLTDFIAKRSQTEKYGVRELNRVIKKDVLSPIAKTLSKGGAKKGAKTTYKMWLQVKNDEVHISVVPKSKTTATKTTATKRSTSKKQEVTAQGN